MKTAMAIAAIIAILTGALSAQDRIEVDLSGMKGSRVAFPAEPITNRLVFQSFPNVDAATNGSVSLRLSVSIVLATLRQQGDITNLVKRLVDNGDVCAAIGHKWQFGCSVGCVIHGPTRHCVVCGKEQW
jgi:hypothetical protein